MKITAKIHNNALRDLLSEAGMDDCRIASLLAGCYGNYAYAEDSYGISVERSRRVVESFAELAEWINKEHDTDLSSRDVAKIMVEAWDDFEQADYWNSHHDL